MAEQDVAMIYNASGQDGGLFGLQHSESVVRQLEGITPQSFYEMKILFGALCDRLGERSLYALAGGNCLITPEPINTSLLFYMAEILGVDPRTVLLIDAVKNAGWDLAGRIQDNGHQMDLLRKWAKNARDPALTPRTITTSTVFLAHEIGVAHGQVLPSALNGSRILDGIYPSKEYLERHPEGVNNSKVENFLLVKEVDEALGTNFSPEGDVAFSVERIVDIITELGKHGKKAMIKADLSTDGMGNVVIDSNQRFEGIPFAELERDIQLQVVRKILREKAIPIGVQAGVVVCEFLEDIIYTPSLEIYSPPHQWGIQPVIYYSCGMLIENGGFAGSIIEDPALFNSVNGGIDPDNLLRYGIPKDVLNRSSEYLALMSSVSRAIQMVSQIRWHDGYVGISDCDLGICLGSDGKLSVKILEFNFNRETGATAQYHIKSKLERMNGSQGVIIARDTVSGSLFGYPIPVIQRELDRIGIGFNRPNGGVIILGHRPGTIMSFVYGRSVAEAIHYDSLLLECAHNGN